MSAILGYSLYQMCDLNLFVMTDLHHTMMEKKTPAEILKHF